MTAAPIWQKPDAVAPARAMQRELRGNALRAPFGPDHEGAAVQMRRAEPAPDFQFLPDHDGPPRPNDPKPHNASRGTALQRFEPVDVAKVYAGPLVQQRGEFLLRIGHRPAVEVGRLLVEGRENLPEDGPVGRVAVGFRQGVYPPAAASSELMNGCSTAASDTVER